MLSIHACLIGLTATKTVAQSRSQRFSTASKWDAQLHLPWRWARRGTAKRDRKYSTSIPGCIPPRDPTLAIKANTVTVIWDWIRNVIVCRHGLGLSCLTRRHILQVRFYALLPFPNHRNTQHTSGRIPSFLPLPCHCLYLPSFCWQDTTCRAQVFSTFGFRSKPRDMIRHYRPNAFPLMSAASLGTLAVNTWYCITQSHPYWWRVDF